MNSYTKMVMLPQHTADPLRYQEPEAPRLNQLAALDQQMQQILSDTVLPPHEKLLKYQQTFHRYQHLHNIPQQVQPIANNIPNEEILSTVPKQAKNKARMLLNHIQQHDDTIKWTPERQLKFDGKVIEGSNMTDLIHSFTRSLPSQLNVPGSTEFGRLLRETNAPQVSFVQRKDSDGFMTPMEMPTFGVENSPFEHSKKQLKEKEKVNRSIERKTLGKRNRKPPNRFGDFATQEQIDWYDYK